MSDPRTPLPANPSLAQLRKQAKERVRAMRAGGSPDVTLADAQYAIAREHGFESWARLKHHVEALRPAGLEPFEQLARELAVAYTSGDERLVRAINADHGTSFPADFHGRLPEVAIAGARQMIAHAFGFDDWAKFASVRPPFYSIDRQEGRLAVSGPQTRKDWEEIFALVEEHGLSKLRAGGITDDAMKGLAELECVTELDISGSKRLTDEGAGHLARMPQLTHLEMGGWGTPLTARAFEPLRQLPRLRQFQSCWTQGFDEEAAAHLAACESIETVNVMGTVSGDGLIRALAGKAALRFLDTGRLVTDAGLPALSDIPVFRRWLGGDVVTGLMGAARLPNRLMIDGAFTDAGIGALTALEGVAALSFFWHSKTFTAAGLEALSGLPHLQVFGIEGDQCGDDAMARIAAIPRLRQLHAQGAVAGEAGWRALSKAGALEQFWGRDCPNFDSDGFRALATMPSLTGMGIDCKRVEDEALALLPVFPQLRELVSMGISDDGFRHVGRCANLEALYCMYCRDTGDIATAHIAGLEKLRGYYAGMTRITDRSLEILGRMLAFEKMEFWQCMEISDAGVAHLAALPHLRELIVDNSPKVSRGIGRAFRENVRVVCRG